MTEPPSSIPVVEFRIRGIRFAIPAGAVAAMALGGGDCVAMEDLVGLERDEAARSRILTLRIKDGEARAGLTGDVNMLDLPADSIHPLPLLIQARNAIRGLAALAMLENSVILVIDPARF